MKNRLLFLGLVIAGLYYYQYYYKELPKVTPLPQTQKKTAVVKPTAKPTQYSQPKIMRIDNYNWQIPTLSTNFNWTEQTPTIEEDGLATISWEDTTPGTIDTFGGGIPVTGKIYKTQVTSADENFTKSGFAYYQTLDEKLLLAGWRNQLPYGSWTLTGIVAGAPYSQIIGYVKTNGSQARSIVFRYDETGEDFIDPKQGFQCPCTVSMSMYISDPVEMSDYIHGLLRK